MHKPPKWNKKCEVLLALTRNVMGLLLAVGFMLYQMIFLNCQILSLKKPNPRELMVCKKLPNS